MPQISVVIPAFNCAAYLPKAIESVLAQTISDLEIVVVDDGSTDNTPAVLDPYLNRIQYIRQPNQGLPGARNTGIRATTGEFVALLDADDSWLPEKLALQMPHFANPRVGIVYSDFSVQYADGRHLPSYLADRPLAGEGYIINNYLRSRFLFPSSMVLRRSALDQCNLFDEELLAAEDIELFARICLRWEVRRVDQPLMIRTEGSGNITANRRKMIEYSILAFRKILEREPTLATDVKRTLHKELARHYWWRGYARFKEGNATQARPDLFKAICYDWRNLRLCGPLLLASFLPTLILKRLQPTT